MPASTDDQSTQRAAAKGLLLVLGAALFYSLIHIGFRLLASRVLGEDDVLDTILSQDLRIAYDAYPRQPPLYNWVLWAVQQVLGPRVEGFLLIKYAALVAAATFLYLSALRATRDWFWAMLTVESLALIYSIGWRYHEGFTHEVGAIAAVTATVWALLKLIDLGRLIDFVVLGIVCGLGLLTEPAYAVFLISLLLAAMLQPTIRSRLLRWPALLSLFIAVALVSPYLLWLADDSRRLAELWRPTQDHFRDSMRGLIYALRGPFFYLSPLIVILPFVFPRFLRTAWHDLRRSPNAAPEPDYEQLVLHASLAAFALSIFGALAFAIKDQPIHVLMPLYVMTVLWLFGAARRSCDHSKYTTRFTTLALAIAGIALIARLANMFVLDPACKICRWGVPYDALATEIRARNFDSGTIVAFEDEIAGNLRQLFPHAKIVTRGRPNFTPAGTSLEKGKFAYVWSAGIPDSHVAQTLGPALLSDQSIATAARLDLPWRHLWRPLGYRKTSWKVVVVQR